MNNLQHLIFAYKHLKALTPINDTRLHKMQFMSLSYVRDLIEVFILDSDFIKSLDKL